MANPRTVISKSVGGVIDLLGKVQEEKQGFAVCERGLRILPGEAESFCKGLIYLAKSEKLRNELGRNGKKFVYTNYSKERLIAEIKNLYCDLLQEKG